MSYVLFMLLAVGLICGTFVRYRFLTKYSRLPPDTEPDKSDQLNGIWLEEDAGEVEPAVKPVGYSTYFDEFLSAIKIFGFLDRKVFHELTRHVRTHRIDAEESVKLADLNGFAVVIEGTMEMFSREPGSGEYEMISEVPRSAPLSSLFSILSFFTEDVELNQNLRSQKDEKYMQDAHTDENSGYANFNLENSDQTSSQSDFDAVNNEIVAVAKSPTTIVVIPEDAFRVLTRSYPAATAGIVQVILYRWSQVTFRTCHKYLNLTREIYETEIRLNNHGYQVPEWLRESAITRLKVLGDSDPSQAVFALKPRKKSGTPFYQHDVMSGSHQVLLEHQSDPAYPGDILSNVPLLGLQSAQLNQRFTSPLVDTSRSTDSVYKCFAESEDGVLRRAIVECMFSIMGFDSKLPHGQTRESSTTDGNRGVWLESLNKRSGFIDVKSSRDEFPNSDNFSSATYESIIERASEFIEIAFYRKGQLLTKAGSKCRGLIYNLDGRLEVGHFPANNEYEKLFDVMPGCIAGYIETVTSYTSSVNVKAATDVCVAILTRDHFERLADKYALLYISAAKTLSTLLTRPIIQLDFALDWVSVKAGSTLFRQDSPADAIYFVLNGRVRSFKEIKEKNGVKLETISEFGQGSCLGELEVLLGKKYNCTVLAVRETELALFPRSLVKTLARRYPSMTFEMARIVAAETMRSLPEANLTASCSNFRTITVLSSTNDLPLSEFADRLSSAFRQNKRHVAVLTNASVLGYLGRHAFSRMGQLKLKAFLADLEEQHDTVLYVADSPARSQWTSTCIDMADCVLLLADAASDPHYGEFERLIVKSKTSNRTHLVLLHPDRYIEPGSTARWLKNRPWVTMHHHVQIGFERSQRSLRSEHGCKNQSLRKFMNIKNLVQDEIFHKRRRKQAVSNNMSNGHNYKDDFGRLARILSGQAIGLVLGGGGARGVSHVGVLRALEEQQIPIDMVGGTSIGSFVGGLYARDYDLLSLYSRAKTFAHRMSSLWRLLLDLTYPATAWTTGHEFNRGVWKAFGQSRIEDFWLKFFTNTTNLTHSRMEIHQTGYSWRYIRASMSLAGLVPPVEDKGQMLMDGGYMDNLPVFEMQKLGASFVIAVDVGAVDDTSPIHYGDTLSGLWVLFNRWNPFSDYPNVPNMAEIQQRLTYVSSVKALEEAKRAKRVLYLRPPIDHYGTLEFSKFDEIVSVGHAYAASQLRNPETLKHLPTLFTQKGNISKRIGLTRRYSI